MKKLLFIFFSLFVFADFCLAQTVGIQVAAPIIKNNPADNTITGYANDLNAGFHVGPTYHSRDSLSAKLTATLYPGMLFHVYGSGVDSMYVWTGTGWIASSGGGGTTTHSVTFDASGAGASPGTAFNGGTAYTISYNTIGAQAAGASAGGILTGTYPNPGLASTAVTPGSYTNTNITVGADGRITAASNGSGAGVIGANQGLYITADSVQLGTPTFGLNSFRTVNIGAVLRFIDPAFLVFAGIGNATTLTLEDGYAQMVTSGSTPMGGGTPYAGDYFSSTIGGATSYTLDFISTNITTGNARGFLLDASNKQNIFYDDDDLVGLRYNSIYDGRAYDTWIPTWSAVKSRADSVVLVAVPSQTGNSGKYLTTNGTATSWASVSGGGGTTTNALMNGYGIGSFSFNGATSGITVIADTSSSSALVSKGRLSTNLGGYVKQTTTVAGFALSGNITLGSHIPGYGLSGSNYTGAGNQTWTADTTSSGGLVSKTRLATNLGGYYKVATQTANTIFAGPSSGSAATPAFRALVAADLPALAGSLSAGSSLTYTTGSAFNGLANTTFDINPSNVNTFLVNQIINKTALGGTTPVQAFLLENSTAATNGTQQVSPWLEIDGYGWGTTASSSQVVGFREWMQPAQSTIPTGVLSFDSNVNGVYTNVAKFTTSGNLTITQQMQANTFLVSKSSLAATYTLSSELLNSSSSTSSIPLQNSPFMDFLGHVWNTTATAADNQFDWEIGASGVSGLTPTSSLLFRSSLQAGSSTSYTTRLSLDNLGDLSLLTGNLTFSTAGQRLFIATGSGSITGDATLVSGTIAVTINGLTSSSRAQATRTVASGTTLTTGYTAVCSSNTLTITADVAAGTINTADNSTYTYVVIN